MHYLDCYATASSTELLITEGLSAFQALKPVRQPRRQALFALQGKLPNALRTNRKQLLTNPVCRDLLAAVANPCPTARSRPARAADQADAPFDHIWLVSDPDVDGAHIRYLFMLFASICMPDLVEQRRIGLISIPAIRVNRPGAEPIYLWPRASEVSTSPKESSNPDSPDSQSFTRFKGVASLSADERSRFVIDSRTRRTVLLTNRTDQTTE